MHEDRLHGLLDSPLDDDRPGRNRRSWIAAGVALAAIATVAVIVVLWGSGGSEEEEAATTSLPEAVAGFPSDRAYAPLVATDAGILMFGGLEPLANLNGDRLSDVWRYDGATGLWWDVEAPTGPPPRAGTAFAYDSQSQLVVLFGGAVGSCEYPFCPDVVNDTWVYDPAENSWERRSPSTAPPARHGHKMVYDSGSDRVVMFGGDSGSSWLEDTWLYDADSDTWTELAAGEDDPWRTAQHAMAYHPIADRVVMWGGADREESPVWALDVDKGVWEQLNAEPVAGSAWDACFVWDASSERLLLFGGEGYTTEEIAEGVTTTGIRLRDQVWALDLEAVAWAELEPLPQAVSGQGCAADPDSTSIVIWHLDTVLLYDPVTGRTTVAESPS